MPWRKMVVGKIITTTNEEQDYPAEGTAEEWEWDLESELWLNTATINKNSEVKYRK